MMPFARRGLIHRLLIAILALAALPLLATNARAYNPESPEVRAMVAKAVKYLEETKSTESRLGGICVVGLACYKATENKNHPKVLAAIAECQKVTAEGYNRTAPDLHYSIGIAIIFLCEVDASAHRKEVEYLYSVQQDLQKGHGGYGYPSGHEGKHTGDTSQTQYGALANWYVRNAGLGVSIEGVEAATNWLLRTQDPNGGWGYQGNDPGPGANYSLEAQTGVNVSMAAAGLGSLYVCADILGFDGGGDRQADREAQREEQRNAGIAEELVRVDQPRPGAGQPITDKVPGDTFSRALSRGNNWFSRNYKIEHDWQYYYLYALERMASFREEYSGREEKEPGWYNDGVKLLMAKQAENGSWTNTVRPAMPADSSTAFATLFLIRGTQRTIARRAELAAGEAIGGRGFATDTGKMRIGAGGELEPLPVERSTAEMLDILANPSHPEFQALVNAGSINLGTDVAARTSHMDRLRAIVSTGEPRARQLAVRNLAQSGNLDNVPIIIYALADANWEVSTEARDGLRFISRKFEGFGLPIEANAVQKKEAQRKWAEWYKSIRPDGQLLSDYTQ